MILPAAPPIEAPQGESLRFMLRELEVVLEGHPFDQLDSLNQIVSHADEEFPAKGAAHFRLTRTGARGREVFERTGPTRKVCCDEIALGYILYRLQNRLIALYEGRTAVHCGAVTIGDRLVLFTGDRGAGKTTLILKLMLEGAAFHCDEIVLAHDGVATTLPRRLHVKEGTLGCLPQLADACADKLLLKYGIGPRFYAVDPTELGHDWRSASGRAAAIFHLTPDFDAPSVVEPMPQIQMVKTLMCQTLSGHRETGRQVADICSMVNGVPCFSLKVGALADAATLVTETVELIIRPMARTDVTRRRRQVVV